jgi:hypothetical protein
MRNKIETYRTDPAYRYDVRAYLLEAKRKREEWYKKQAENESK